MIQTTALTKTFGRIVAVDAADLSISPGQVVGFLGPNGAGKTTTLRMICGFLPPTSGSVHVGGHDVATDGRAARRLIGYLPESTPLYHEMRVREYLRFRAKIFGMPRSRRKRAIDLAIDRCWLRDVARRPINQLSKGFRQRVGLAAALLHEPPLLILDEPTVGLDPSQIREVRSLVRELAGEQTILFSTHILPEVEATCDRIVMIAGGRIQADGTIDELRASAAGESRYMIETDTPQNLDRIRAMPEVRDVQSMPLDARWYQFTVLAADARADLRPALWQTLAQAPGTVRELRRDAASLEQLFVRLSTGTQIDLHGRGSGQQENAA